MGPVMNAALDADAGWEDPREKKLTITFEEPASCLAKEQLEDAVREAIASAKACYSDSQCTLSSFGCPFGCRIAVRAERLKAIERSVADYRNYMESRYCGRCVYRCVSIRNHEAACVNGRCTAVSQGPLEQPATGSVPGR